MSEPKRYDARLVTDVCGNKDVLMKGAHDGLFVHYDACSALQAQLHSAEQRITELQRARVADSEIIGRWQCQAEAAERCIESWKEEEKVWRQSDQEHRIKHQQMQAGAEELIEKNLAAEQRIAVLTEALRGVEWEESTNGVLYCVHCGNLKSYGKHQDDCKMGAALSHGEQP